MSHVAVPVDPSSFLRTRRGALDIVDLPDFGFVVVEGGGAPEGESFAEALSALYAVSYSAHFAVKRENGIATRVMPLEALWWVDDPSLQGLVFEVARGVGSMADVDRTRWCWQAMMLQPEPIDEDTITRAVQQLREKKDLPGLDRLTYLRWTEGLCAQILHIGPYSDEAPSVVRLHEGIAAAGYRPRGRHHEIYLGDPRRSAPEKLRTLLRQPVEPA